MKHFLFSALAFSIFVPAARADFVIDSPEVEKGYADIETTHSFAFDHRNIQNAAHEHRLGFDYAPTEGWLLTIEGIESKQPHDDYRYIATNFETIITLAKAEDHWMASGLRLHYQFGHDNNPGETEAALLLQKTAGKFIHTANLVLDRQTGPQRENNAQGGFAWRTVYACTDDLHPGIELFSSLGRVSHFSAFQAEKHRIGPSLQGKLGRLDYDIGWLFGLTRASDDHMLKVNLAYEF